MKCEVCKEKVEENFLNKIFGTYVKDTKGKKHVVCSSCQRKLLSKEEILEKI